MCVGLFSHVSIIAPGHGGERSTVDHLLLIHTFGLVIDRMIVSVVERFD